MILSNPVVVVGVSSREAFFPCVRDHVPVADDNHVPSSFLPHGNSDAQWWRCENLGRSQDRPDLKAQSGAQGGAGELCPKNGGLWTCPKVTFVLPKKSVLDHP